jgi:hypothetical protein
VYCDLDGVLVDFARGITEVFGWSERATSQNIDALSRRELWERVQGAESFFEHLPWMPDGERLWRAIAPLRPDILTGVPAYCRRAPRAEKFRWCARELARLSSAADNVAAFHHVDMAGPARTHAPPPADAAGWGERRGPHRSASSSAADDSAARERDDDEWHCSVITCWSECKQYESGVGKVLIDDRVDLKSSWEAAGGIFIHHTSAADSIRQLKHLGILPSDDANPWQQELQP